MGEPILDRWEAAVRSGGTPVRLTEARAYLASQLGAYDPAVAKASLVAAVSCSDLLRALAGTAGLVALYFLLPLERLANIPL